MKMMPAESRLKHKRMTSSSTVRRRTTIAVHVPGEAGFWIDEAHDVTLIDCTASNNHWGVVVSQSDLVTIDDCWIGNAKEPDGGSWGGLKVNTGQGLILSPFAGVRNLTVEANCTFSNNGNAQATTRGMCTMAILCLNDTTEYTPWPSMKFQDNRPLRIEWPVHYRGAMGVRPGQRAPKSN